MMIQALAPAGSASRAGKLGVSVGAQHFGALIAALSSPRAGRVGPSVTPTSNVAGSPSVAGASVPDPAARATHIETRFRLVDQVMPLGPGESSDATSASVPGHIVCSAGAPRIYVRGHQDASKMPEHGDPSPAGRVRRASALPALPQSFLAMPGKPSDPPTLSPCVNPDAPPRRVLFPVHPAAPPRSSRPSAQYAASSALAANIVGETPANRTGSVLSIPAVTNLAGSNTVASIDAARSALSLKLAFGSAPLMAPGLLQTSDPRARPGAVVAGGGETTRGSPPLSNDGSGRREIEARADLAPQMHSVALALSGAGRERTNLPRPLDSMRSALQPWPAAISLNDSSTLQDAQRSLNEAVTRASLGAASSRLLTPATPPSHGSNLASLPTSTPGHQPACPTDSAPAATLDGSELSFSASLASSAKASATASMQPTVTASSITQAARTEPVAQNDSRTRVGSPSSDAPVGRPESLTPEPVPTSANRTPAVSANLAFPDVPDADGVSEHAARSGTRSFQDRSVEAHANISIGAPNTGLSSFPGVVPTAPAPQTATASSLGFAETVHNLVETAASRDDSTWRNSAIGNGGATLHLHPPSLGELNLTLAMEQARVAVEVTAAASQTHAIFHHAQGALAHALADVGLRLDTLNVVTAGGRALSDAGSKDPSARSHEIPELSALAVASEPQALAVNRLPAITHRGHVNVYA